MREPEYQTQKSKFACFQWGAFEAEAREGEYIWYIIIYKIYMIYYIIYYM